MNVRGGVGQQTGEIVRKGWEGGGGGVREGWGLGGRGGGGHEKGRRCEGVEEWG